MKISKNLIYFALLAFLLTLVITIVIIIIGYSNLNTNQINPISYPLSYTISYPISYTNSKGSTINTINYPLFPPLKASDYLPSFVPNDPNWAAIYDYYGQLAIKNFSLAYPIGAQGRSYSAFVNLYKNISEIDAAVYNKLAPNQYLVQVRIRNGTNIDFYKVILNMGMNNNHIIISSSTSTKYSGKVYVDCGRDDFPYLQPKHCVLRDWNSGELMYLTSLGILTGPTSAIFKQGKVVNNIQYLVSNPGGDGGGATTIIYAYNLEDKSIKFDNRYFFYSPQLTLEVNLSCQGDKLEDYTTGCLKKYVDKGMFKDNIEYLTNVSKYL